MLAGLWQNQLNALDTSDDGLVVPNDVLVGVNEQNNKTVTGENGELPDRALHPDLPFWDTNGDDLFVPNDILRIINAINGDTESPVIVASLLNDTALGGTNNDGVTFDGTVSGISDLLSSEDIGQCKLRNLRSADVEYAIGKAPECLGSGRFGDVYRGSLYGQEIAVKVLSHKNKNGDQGKLYSCNPN